MTITHALVFWLGYLDTCVATGKAVGGTHDIRFCGVGDEVELFIGRPVDSDGFWQILLEPYPETGLAKYKLKIARYSKVRNGECALPKQFAGSGSEYPLWNMAVRRLRTKSAQPKDAIIFLRDKKGRFHARIIAKEKLLAMPEQIHECLRQGNECGQCVEFKEDFDLHDLPISAALATATAERKSLVAFLDGSRREVARELAVRNTALIQAAKGFYPTVCCVCGFDFAKIYGKRGRGFIEAHHLKPVAFYQKAGRTVTVRDIRLVCANCHRMLHRGSRLLAIAELKRIVVEQRRNQ